MIRVPPAAKGAIETVQHLLRALGREIGDPLKLGARDGQVTALFGCAQLAAVRLPDHLALFQRDVPDPATRVCPPAQARLLCGSGIQPIAPTHVRLRHLHESTNAL
jgi:hypothetical protein